MKNQPNAPAPERMTPERLAEIRRHAEQGDREMGDMLQAWTQAAEDRSDLIAELDAVRAENERLTSWQKLIEDAPGESKEIALERYRKAGVIGPIVESWRKENDALRNLAHGLLAEAMEGNERLRAALTSILDNELTAHPESKLGISLAAARSALEPHP